jgi:hypothetical protein
VPAVTTDTTTTTTAETVPLTKYTVDEGDVALIILVGDFSNSQSTLNVDSAVKGMVSDGRVLKSETVIQLDGHEGRYVQLTDRNGFQLSDMAFVIGRRLYQLITVTPRSATPAQAAEVARFAQTFHFSKP